MPEPSEAIQRLREMHHDRGGYCNCCGGKWPCLTLKAVEALALAPGTARVCWPDGREEVVKVTRWMQDLYRLTPLEEGK